MLGLADRPSAAIQQLDGDAQLAVSELTGRDAVTRAAIGQHQGHFDRLACGGGSSRPADFDGAGRNNRVPDGERMVVYGPFGMDVGQDVPLRQPLAGGGHVALGAGVLVRRRSRQIQRGVLLRLHRVANAAEVGAGQPHRVPHDRMRTDPAFVRSGIGLTQLVTRAALDAELALIVAKLGRLSGRLFQQRPRGMTWQAIGNRPLVRRQDELRIRPGDSVGGPLPLRGDVRVAVGAALRRAILHLAFRQTAAGQRQQQGELCSEPAADPKGIRGRTVHDLVPDAAEALTARRHVVRRRGKPGNSETVASSELKEHRVAGGQVLVLSLPVANLQAEDQLLGHVERHVAEQKRVIDAASGLHVRV